jgi:hypothetical protein
MKKKVKWKITKEKLRITIQKMKKKELEKRKRKYKLKEFIIIQKRIKVKGLLKKKKNGENSKS